MPIRMPIISPIGRGPKGDKGDPGEATSEFLAEVRNIVESVVGDFGDRINQLVTQTTTVKNEANDAVANANAALVTINQATQDAIANANQAIAAANQAKSTIDSAVQNIEQHGFSASNGSLTVAHGGTGGTNAAEARTALGITPANIGAKSKSEFAVLNIPVTAHGNNQVLSGHVSYPSGFNINNCVPISTSEYDSEDDYWTCSNYGSAGYLVEQNVRLYADGVYAYKFVAVGTTSTGQGTVRVVLMKIS